MNNHSKILKEGPQENIDLNPILERYTAAKNRRGNWEKLWQDCYDYALPQNAGFTFSQMPGQPRTDKIYDATALDAADRLAASLLGNLTPIWSQWFGLKPGPDLTSAEADRLAPTLEKTAKTIQDHFDRSNFAVEIHQCYLDLVVGGTASLYFEEAAPGEFSAFQFSAVPLSQSVLEEGAAGRLENSYRIIDMTIRQIAERYGNLESIPRDILKTAAKDPQTRFKVMEAVLSENLVYSYYAILIEDSENPLLLGAGQFEDSPVISFRWLKSPGEIYGRSPVMKALPDIKTANKIVELVLKNASIAVTGIWQADDDGVLNPANIELTPAQLFQRQLAQKACSLWKCRVASMCRS